MLDKDYCSCFPERIQGIFIGDICKLHDNEVGEKGTYNPISPAINLYKRLKERKISLFFCLLITFGGTLMTYIKYPYFAYKIYKYRKEVSE